MTTTRLLWVRAIAILALSFALTDCGGKSPAVPEAAYSTEIVGAWRGSVRNLSESMVINADGTFICHLQKTGFIADMLYPAQPGTVSGTWSLTGSVMTMAITGARNERLANGMASSTIVGFRKNEIVPKSRGNTSSFFRTTGGL